MLQKLEVDLIDSFEHIPVKIFPSSKDGSVYVAQEIASIIRQKQAAGDPCVLGLATGSTPISMYAELVRLHREEGLGFRNVITFNLDEYYLLDQEAFQSYWSFMYRHLFNHIDIHPDNINIPNGALSKEDVKRFCIEYEEKMQQVGGIDLQILGIGNNGHIGFNEPGSSIFSKLRLTWFYNSNRNSNS